MLQLRRLVPGLQGVGVFRGFRVLARSFVKLLQLPFCEGDCDLNPKP